MKPLSRAEKRKIREAFVQNIECTTVSTDFVVTDWMTGNPVTSQTHQEAITDYVEHMILRVAKLLGVE